MAKKAALESKQPTGSVVPQNAPCQRAGKTVQQPKAEVERILKYREEDNHFKIRWQESWVPGEFLTPELVAAFHTAKREEEANQRAQAAEQKLKAKKRAEERAAKAAERAARAARQELAGHKRKSRCKTCKGSGTLEVDFGNGGGFDSECHDCLGTGVWE